MKKVNIFKSTMLIMAMTIISRFIGLFRDLIIANKFGATYYTDAYKASTIVPETLFMIVGLAITTTFLPLLSKIKTEEGKKEMNDFANNIVNIVLILSVFAFLFIFLFSESVVSIVAGGLSIEAKEIAISLTKIVGVNIIFLSLNACFVAILQVNEDFVVPAILGLFFNLPIILYVLLSKDCNIYGLTIANVLGNICRVLVQIPSLIKNGYKYKFIVSFKDKKVRRLLFLIIPVVIGAGANSINLVVDKRIVSSFSEGSITTLDNAQMISTVINSVFTAAVTSVVYPVMTNLRNRGETKKYYELLSKSVVYLAIILIPLTGGLLLFSKDIISIIFPAYSSEAKTLATLSLLGYAIGIFFVGVRDVFNSTFFSMNKTKITAKNGMIGVAINIILSLILSRIIGISGVAVASSIAMGVTAVLLIKELRKMKVELNLRDIGIKSIKITLASVIMVCVIIIVNMIFTTNGITKLLIGVVTGVPIYFILLKIFKLTEIEDILKLKFRNKE